MIPKPVENRLRGSIIVATSPHKVNDKIQAHLHVFKFFKKAIHTDVNIVVDEENHMKYWYTSLKIKNQEYALTGNPNTERHDINSYITRICESVLENV